jgi:hypothetical protein
MTLYRRGFKIARTHHVSLEIASFPSSYEFYTRRGSWRCAGTRTPAPYCRPVRQRNTEVAEVDRKVQAGVVTSHCGIGSHILEEGLYALLADNRGCEITGLLEDEEDDNASEVGGLGVNEDCLRDVRVGVGGGGGGGWGRSRRRGACGRSGLKDNAVGSCGRIVLAREEKVVDYSSGCGIGIGEDAICFSFSIFKKGNGAFLGIAIESNHGIFA